MVLDEQHKFEALLLEGISDIKLSRPGIEFYVRRIVQGQPFAFVKRTHGIWDNLAMLLERAGIHGSKPETPADTDRIHRAMKKMAEEQVSRKRQLWVYHFLNDLLEDLQNVVSGGAFYEAISFRGYPRDGPHRAGADSERTLSELAAAVLAFCNKQPQWHDALVWKEAVLCGTFHRLLESLRQVRVLLIGPAHLNGLGKILEPKAFHHLKIRTVGAIYDREVILKQALRLIKRFVHEARSSDLPTVVVFQAGALAHWLIYRLYRRAPGTFYLDLGRVLDIWFPSVVKSQPWFARNRQTIVRNMGLEGIHT